jgi:hypothetical protein
MTTRQAEVGRESGVAVEIAEGVEFADIPFRGGGQVGLDERELRESGERSPQPPEPCCWTP